MWKFLAASIGLTAVLAAVGYGPTVRLGGESAWREMLAGCGISLIGSWIGIAPVLLARREGGQPFNAVASSAVLRLVVTLGLALSVVLSEWLDRRPLLIWVGISYCVLLVVETMFAVRMTSRARR